MKTLLGYLNKFILFFIPETRGFALKRFLYRLQGYEIGENTRICSSARLFGSGSIVIGNNVWIGPEVMIISSSKIMIEDNVDIAPRVFIGTGTHTMGDIPERMAGTGISKDIKVKNGAWLGSNVTIQPGVVVAEMSVVNSGAVVTKDFPSYSMVAGIPAKVIKDLRNS